MSARPARQTSIPAFIDRRAMTFAGSAGSPPRVELETSPTDRYGVALARVRVPAGTVISGTVTDHTLAIAVSEPVPAEHMMAGKRGHYDASPGALCIAPTGMDYVLEYGGPIAGIMLQVSPECLALAGAQLTRHGGTLIDQMDGRDVALQRIAHGMEAEGAAGHPNGALFWSCATDTLLRHLVNRHCTTPAAPLRGSIDAHDLRRLDAFIEDHVDTAIDLAALAVVIGCDRFHFAHRFRATVGVSPYRYVVRRRLERARALLLAGRQSIADIALATGFNDQSHLTYWVRRVYGTTPKRLLAHGRGLVSLAPEEGSEAA